MTYFQAGFSKCVDESLYKLQKEKVTAIPALGYQMLPGVAPEPGSLLWRDYPLGSPWVMMSKIGIFHPDRITETNFGVGRHKAAFLGDVVLHKRDEVCNFHYKYLGIEATHARQQALEARLGPKDRERNYGHKYRWDMQRLREDFEHCQKTAVNVHDRHHHEEHPEPRWWRTG